MINTSNVIRFIFFMEQSNHASYFTALAEKIQICASPVKTSHTILHPKTPFLHESKEELDVLQLYYVMEPINTKYTIVVGEDKRMKTLAYNWGTQRNWTLSFQIPLILVPFPSVKEECYSKNEKLQKCLLSLTMCDTITSCVIHSSSLDLIENGIYYCNNK